MGIISGVNKAMRGINTVTRVNKWLSKPKVSAKINQYRTKAKALLGDKRRLRKVGRKVGRGLATGAAVAGMAVMGRRLGVKGSVMAGLAGYGAHKVASKLSPAYAAKAAKKSAAVQRLARMTGKGMVLNKRGPLAPVARAAKTAAGQRVVQGIKQAGAKWKSMSTGKKVMAGVAAYGAYRAVKKATSPSGREKIARLAGRTVKRVRRNTGGVGRSLLGPLASPFVRFGRRKQRRY